MVGNIMQLDGVHSTWKPSIVAALQQMDVNYLSELEQTTDWLPGKNNLFAAFSMPMSEVKYVLLGESPYPRIESANGYAFWDAQVTTLWSETGLSKKVNRATSLRNFIKMLLVARGDLCLDNISQAAITQLDNKRYVQTAEQFFLGMLQKGFLLLNASLVYREGEVPYHAKHWQPFLEKIIGDLSQRVSTQRYKNQKNFSIKWIVLGNIAKKIKIPLCDIGLAAEHPYNLSFISNSQVIQFFKPLNLLSPV